ncbi:MAG: multicopper oxidase family protein [Pseudonocardia sp.]|nr:multicopper oxidase family protein [Pseudonocardia sp.]
MPRPGVAVGGRRRGVVAGLAATLAVLGPLGWFWQDSLVPSTYSVMDRGSVDTGGGAPVMTTTGAHPMAGMTGMTGVRSVADLRDPAAGPPDVDLTFTARKGTVRLASGQVVEDGYTIDGTSPGPEIHAVEGQLVQVMLRNADVPDGVTLHWHGLDVPNGDDGVAGVTQDAVLPGMSFTYRFTAERAGTYWYHSHQVSHEQVQKGLFGAVVISPRAPAEVPDALALVHLYSGNRTVNGLAGDVPVPAAPGSRVRVRVVNTDNGPMSAWVSGAAFRVVAVDGRELHEPGELRDTTVGVTAGGRADLEVAVPADGAGARVELGGNAAIVLGGSRAAPSPRPGRTLDLLAYGTPAPLGLDPGAADRTFTYAVGRRLGFVDGVPGMWWTVNGHLFPDVPMFVVREGDVVRMRITNSSGEVHPLHLHGHHAVVLAHDGVPASGSPWWFDSLDVEDGGSYDVAFVADNPGIWMDHCHNLTHAAEGLVAHLMYDGVTEPYLVGGSGANAPE